MKNLLLILALFVVGCGPSLEEAKNAGFSSVDEYIEFQQYGFNNKASFTETGFSSLIEYQAYKNQGFESMQSFRSSGFESLEQFRKLKEYGKTMEEVMEYEGVSFQEFEDCKISGYDTYCKGKMASMYATLDSFSTDGVRLYLKKNCNDKDFISVDAPNLGKGFHDSNKKRCGKFLFRIGDKNWLYPDIYVNETLWIETDKEFYSRIEKIVVAKAEKLKADREALEKNKKNAKWLAENYMGEASYICALLVEQYAKYDFKWEGYGSKFSNYSGKVKKPYVLTIFGDKIKLQNGFGAWQRKQYSCDYNVKEKKPLKVTFN